MSRRTAVKTPGARRNKERASIFERVTEGERFGK